VWYVTGLGPAWLQKVALYFRGVTEPLPGKSRLVVLSIATIIFLVPIALVAIPTLATLLWLMNWTNPPRDEEEDVTEVLQSVN
jgi:hypothetical protein